MSIQAEEIRLSAAPAGNTQGSPEEVERANDELLIVAEGFVSNLWAVIAEQVGLDPVRDRVISGSMKMELGEQAAKSILDYSA